MSTHGESAREQERQHFSLVVERVRKLEKELVSVYDEMLAVIKRMDEREGVDVAIRITPALAASFKQLEVEKDDPDGLREPSIIRGHARSA